MYVHMHIYIYTTIPDSMTRRVQSCSSRSAFKLSPDTPFARLSRHRMRLRLFVLIRWTPSGGAQLLIYNSQLRGSLIPEVPRDVDFLWMCKMCILMHVCVWFLQTAHTLMLARRV